MGQLTNQYVSQSYQGLLKLNDSTTGVTENLQYVTDGLGNNIPMKVSTTEVVITGSFSGDGSGLTGLTVNSGSLVTTSSFNAYTSSVNGQLSSLEQETSSLQSQINGLATTSSVTSLSSSIASTDLGQDNRLNSLEQKTGSLQSQINSLSTSSLQYTTTSSFNSYTSSNNARVSSLEGATGSLQNQINGLATTSSLTSLSSSIAVTDLSQNNRLNSIESTTSSLQSQIDTKLNTSSFNSYVSSNDARVSSLESKTGSYATTGSNVFKGDQVISGSLDVTGTVTALSASITYLKTIYQTSSVIFTSGSNILGDEASDTQTLFGTVKIPTGPLSVTGSGNISGQFTASGLNYPTVDDGVKSFIQTDGAGNLSLQYVDAVNEKIKNGEATTITKGTPLYVSGATGANPIVYRADASDPNKMPVTYIAGDNIASGATGRGIILGLIEGVNTTGYPEGTEIYVAPGGGWTATRPTGNSIVQVLGIVTKEGNGGKGLVLNPGPVLLPNVSTGKLWVGDVNGHPQEVATSSLNVNSASYALSSSYATQALSASWAPSVTIDTGSFATTGSNVFNGSQVITGSLGLGGTLYPTGSRENITLFGGKNYSGSLPTSYLNAITTSLNGTETNIAMLPNAQQLQSVGGNLASLSGSVFISGGANFIAALGSQIPSSQGRRQIIGNANYVVSAPTINTSSLTIPTISNNYLLGALQLTLTTGSNNQAHQINQNILAGSIGINHPSASLTGQGTIVSNNVNVGGVTSNTNGPTQLTVASSLSNNIISHASMTMNQFSSSVQTSNNVIAGGGTLVINNRYYQTGSNNNVVFSSNLVAGQNITANFNGSPATNVARGLVGNVIAGQAVNLSMEPVNTDLGSLRNSIVIGMGLNVSGSHSAANTATQGATFIGRWNDESNGLADSARTVFAVGTGTAAGSRKTALYVTSGSLVGISGSLEVTNGITGSLSGTASYATQALSASWAPAPDLSGYVTTGTLTSLSSSIATTDLGQDNRLTSIEGVTGSFATTSSLTSLSSSIAVTDLGQNNRLTSIEGITGSLATTSSLTSLSSSIATTDLNQDNKINSLISATGSYASKSGNTFNGSQIITGSIQGNVSSLSITSNTASIDTSVGNFFTLGLVPTTPTHIKLNTLRPGQTINLLVTTAAGSTVTFESNIKQPSGGSYSPSSGTATDVLTFVTFDGTNAYLANVKNLI